LTTLRTYSAVQSLGELYTQIISLLGFRRFDEYKAMGLAPYGDPTVYQGLFEASYQLLPDGDYRLDLLDQWMQRLATAGLIKRARRRGQSFTQVHMDLAAALQKTVERIVLHILAHYQKHTGQRRLCLAGGVTHNCSATGTVLYSGLFDDVFVQPAAHDAGTALGAAIHADRHSRCAARRSRWTHVYLGTHIGDNKAASCALERWEPFVEIEPIGPTFDNLASRLAKGVVIGWVQGHSEFGPRALGNRSILADPRPAQNKTRINAMVKKREAFRPFAPVVLSERLNDYFDVPVGYTEFPFMTFILKVKPEVQHLLGAITHVDGTARVQTVSREQNLPLWSLLRAFERETGIGMLLNTSFNNNAEPIVDTVDDAMSCFLTTGLDAVVIGNWLMTKRWDEIPDALYATMVPQIPPFRRLVKARQLNHLTGHVEDIYVLESTRSDVFGPLQVRISAGLAGLLWAARGRQTCGELCAQLGITSQDRHHLYSEAGRLWGDRVLVLIPSPGTEHTALDAHLTSASRRA
jgi:carbamoyltransferase